MRRWVVTVEEEREELSPIEIVLALLSTPHMALAAFFSPIFQGEEEPKEKKITSIMERFMVRSRTSSAPNKEETETNTKRGTFMLKGRRFLA
jgi:hypothetical protein